jgi:hypothetical protein
MAKGSEYTPGDGQYGEQLVPELPSTRARQHANSPIARKMLSESIDANFDFGGRFDGIRCADQAVNKA